MEWYVYYDPRYRDYVCSNIKYVYVLSMVTDTPRRIHNKL